MTSAHDFSATGIDGVDRPLSQYRDSVVLIVNTASQCGLTPQYAGLQELYDTYRDRGFVVLGFPCDQFAHQEPGTEAEIAAFCETSYGVTFPMFAKVEVNGEHEHPLYAWLKEQRRGALGGAIKWNFTKFLVDRDGAVVNRYAPTTVPAKIAADVAALLD
jgi:glutathione peroxidase